MTKIEIAVAYHKNSEVIKNNCLLPIQVGKACSDIELNMQGDDTGDNISEKNFGYAELTAIYWLWKNSKADVKGLFHYRRFLDLSANNSKVEDLFEYKISDNFSAQNFLNNLGIDQNNIISLLEKYSIITRKKEDLRNWSNYTIKSHYAAEHHAEHLEKALEIIKNDYPDYYPTANKLVNGHESYFTNIFIMKNEQYDEYCSWLFDILFKIEKTINLYDKSLAPNTKKTRWAGFLGERLTAIYIQKQIDAGKKVGEFPVTILTPNSNYKWYECNTYDTNLYVKKCENKVIIKNHENPQQPIISVCIAAYNVEKYIEKCLSSVINQTLQNIEIIVVNDGSKDNTLAIIQKISTKDKRIKIINQENKGLGNTRNCAINVAQGKYIHLMDADDYMDNTFLENMVRNAEQNQSDMVISTHRGVDEQNVNVLYVSSLPHTLLKNKINLIDNIDVLLVPCHVWDKIYLKSLIQDIPFTPEGGEDIFFWYRTVLKAKQISIHRNCEYNYRINTKSVQSNPNYALGVFENLQKTQDLIMNTNDSTIIGMFNIFKDILIGHMLYRAHSLLETNRKFRLKFYENAKYFLEMTPLPIELIKKKEWYPTDFTLIERIKQCKSFKNFEEIINVQSSQKLMLMLIKYKIKKLFCKSKKKQKYQIRSNELLKKIKFPVKFKIFNTTLVKIQNKNKNFKIYVLGIPFVKYVTKDIYRKYYFLGLPIISKNHIKIKFLGITIRNRMDEYLIRTFDYLGWKVNDIYQGCFDDIGYHLHDVIPEKLEEIKNKLK